MQLLSALAGAAIAFAAHGGKTAVRAVITPSPEPVSNIALSAGEDVLAVFLTWFATRHPYASATIALVLVVVIVILARWVYRALRKLFRGAENVVARGADN
jgi:cadmium resistance protein CadD (predicted permease)